MGFAAHIHYLKGWLLVRDPLVWKSINVSESFWSLRSQPRLMNWSRCDDLGLKRLFTHGASEKPKQTLSAWQISPALRAAHIPAEPRAVYHAGETRNQHFCHRGYCHILWTTLHPINTLQDLGDLILKAPHRFGKAEMLSQLSPCDTKLSSQLSAASSLQLEKHQAGSQIQLLQTQGCNSTHSLFKVYIKAEPETTQETEAG